MFRIGLSGTNWTGKSETIDRFIRNCLPSGIEVVSLSILVAQCPFPMIKDQTFEGSQWMVEQIRNTLNNYSGEMQIFDRTPLDILAFTLYAENQTSQKAPKLVDDILDLFKYFDFIFSTQPSGEWPVNVCTTPEEIRFAMEIDYYMHEAIDQFAIEVVSLPWKLAERQRLLSDYLLGLPST